MALWAITIFSMEDLKKRNVYKDTLIRSLSRYAENVLSILSGKSDVNASGIKIESLILDRLWKEPGIKKVIRNLL